MAVEGKNVVLLSVSVGTMVSEVVMIEAKTLLEFLLGKTPTTQAQGRAVAEGERQEDEDEDEDEGAMAARFGS